MPSDPHQKEKICIITPEFPVLGGTRSVLLVLLSVLAGISEPIVLARKCGDSAYMQYDLGLSSWVRGWFSPWFLSSLPFYELVGVLWCLILRLRGVKKFLVQDSVFSGLFTSFVCHSTGGQFYLFDYGSAVNVDNGLLERELTQAQPVTVAGLQLNVMRRIRWLSLRTCKIFFVHSPDMKALAHNSGLSESHIAEYGFPVNSKVYRRDGEDRRMLRRRLAVDDCFCILYAGRMTLDKGLPLLVQAYAQLAKEYPGRLRLLMVGSGPEKTALVKLSEGLEGVIFVDVVENPSRVAGLMSAADAFVYPIIYSGGVAMAVLEAMACELPVIVGPAGPTRDVIVDGTNGFVMREAQAKFIADVVRYLLEHPGVAGGVGRKARETVVGRFGIEQYRERVVQRIMKSD